MNKDLDKLKSDAGLLLQDLIRLPSYSTDEWQTASHLIKYGFDRGLAMTRVGNNVLTLNTHFDPAKPTMLLNSHHDTVKPAQGYTRDPFDPAIEDGKIFGLGSNDAGGALVALFSTFLYFHKDENLKYNLAFAATAEEEISGANGIVQALQYLPPIDCAIVGEPTSLQLAVAERGLIVVDCEARGSAGHAARDEGINAIYIALNDIDWIRNYRFPLVSESLGPVKTTVTVIETANKAHNVVPASCRFSLDIRLNELYSPEEVLTTLRQQMKSDIVPRSTRLRATAISMDHPLVRAGLNLGRKPYGSPTLSDKALMPFPALKLGPGESSRSHTADEFIKVEELNQGIDLYIDILKQLLK